MSFPHLRVPMPKKKITYKRGSKGTKYVYYTLRAYRNDKGKPTSDEVSIGKKDLETGELIPNKNYFKYFSEKPKLNEKLELNEEPKSNITDIPIKIQDYGNSYVLYQMAKQLKLDELLKQHFKDKWEEILTIAGYMVCKGNVMMYLANWCETTQTLLKTKSKAKQ